METRKPLSEMIQNTKYQSIANKLKEGILPEGFTAKVWIFSCDIKKPQDKAKIFDENGNVFATYRSFAGAWTLADGIPHDVISYIAETPVISQGLFKEKEDEYIRENTIAYAIDEYGFKAKDFAEIRQALEDGKLPEDFSIREIQSTDSSENKYQSYLYYKDVLFARLDSEKAEWELVAISRIEKVPPITHEIISRIGDTKTVTSEKVHEQEDSMKSIDDIILDAEKKVNEKVYTFGTEEYLPSKEEYRLTTSKIKNINESLQHGRIPTECSYERYYFDGESKEFQYRLPDDRVDCDTIYYESRVVQNESCIGKSQYKLASLTSFKDGMEWVIAKTPRSIDDRIITSKEIPMIGTSATKTPEILLGFREIVDNDEKGQINIKNISIGSHKIKLEEFGQLREQLEKGKFPKDITMKRKDGSVVSHAQLNVMMTFRGNECFETGDKLYYKGELLACYTHGIFGGAWSLTPGVLDKNTIPINDADLSSIAGKKTSSEYYIRKTCEIVYEQNELNKELKEKGNFDKDIREEIL